MRQALTCLLAIVIILCPPVFGAEPQADETVTIERHVDGSVTFTISLDAVKRCDREGGCDVVSMDMVLRVMKNLKPKICNEKEI